MGAGKRTKATGQTIRGRVQETAGKMLGQDRARRKGKAEQLKADVKHAGERARHLFKH